MGSEKGETKYKKGHKAHFEGKKVDEDLFFACLDLFLLNRMTLDSACTLIGLSKPTLTKRWNAVLLEEEIPRSWFGHMSEEQESIRKKVIRKSDTMARNLQLGKTVRIRKIVKNKKSQIVIDYLTSDEKREFNGKE